MVLITSTGIGGLVGDHLDMTRPLSQYDRTDAFDKMATFKKKAEIAGNGLGKEASRTMLTSGTSYYNHRNTTNPVEQYRKTLQASLYGACYNNQSNGILGKNNNSESAKQRAMSVIELQKMKTESRSRSGKHHGLLTGVDAGVAERETMSLNTRANFNDKSKHAYRSTYGNLSWCANNQSFKNNLNKSNAMTDKEVDKTLDLIGEKAAFKFKKLNSCFRCVDVDKSGSIDRNEMVGFFRQFCLPPAEAHRLFDRLDDDNSGELDYCEMMAHFGPRINPGCPPPVNYKSPLIAGQVFEPNVVGFNLRKLG